MQFDIFYSPKFLLVQFTSLAMLLLLLCSALLNQNLTRPVVMVIGLVFIGVGVVGHISTLSMETRAKELVAEHLLSAQVFEDFTRYREVFAYLFPAISAAVGTNVISDALLKHHTYERSFSLIQFVKDVVSALWLPIGFLLSCVAAMLWVISLPIPPARRYFRSSIPRILRRTRLKFLKLSIIARYILRKKL